MEFMLFFTIATAFAETLIFNGNIFGWPFLHYILKDSHYFSYLCQETNSTANKSEINDAISCDSQDASFSLVYLLAVSFMSVTSFPLGYLLDRFGTWIFRSCASTMFTLGYALLAISNPSTSFLLYPFSVLIGVSGFGLMISNFQLGNLTSSAKGSVITLLNGLFDSSIVIMFLFKKGYDASVNPHLIFQIMTGATLFIWMRTYVFMPKKIIPLSVKSSSAIYGWMEWICFKTKQDNQTKIGIKLDDSGPTNFKKHLIVENVTPKPIKANISFKKSLLKKYFWSNLFHYCIITFRLNFFLGNVLSWLKGFVKADETSSFVDILGYITMFGAFVAPINGLIIDLVAKHQRKHNKSTKVINMNASLVSMLTTSILAIMLSVCAIVPTAIPSFILFLFARSFLFGGNVTFLSVLFPMEHFGKTIGLVSFFSGITITMYYVLVLIANKFDPTFYYINIGLLIITAFTLIHPLVLFLELRKLKQRQGVNVNYKL